MVIARLAIIGPCTRARRAVQVRVWVWRWGCDTFPVQKEDAMHSASHCGIQNKNPLTVYKWFVIISALSPSNLTFLDSGFELLRRYIDGGGEAYDVGYSWPENGLRHIASFVYQILHTQFHLRI